jgi:transposase
LVHLEPATVQAIAAPRAEARRDVQEPPGAHLDATGWREGPHRAWRWTAVTAGVTVVVVRRSRGGKVAPELLGARFGGWLITARWRGDHGYPPWRRQLCWAHRARDLDAMLERGGRSHALGEARRDQMRQLLHWWHRVRDGTLAHVSLASSRRPVQREGERRLEEGQPGGVQKTEGVCREILKRRQALGTFVRHEGGEPTHNPAARAIRPGGLGRKGSFGTQRPEGSRFVDVMMTAVATLTQPHRHVLDDLTVACEARWRGDPAPSLLPTPAHLSELLHPAA